MALAEAYKLKITGSTVLEFPITPEFFPQLKMDWKRDGKEHRVSETYPIHGWLVGTGADDDAIQASVQSQYDALRALALQGTPSKIEFIEAVSGLVVKTIARAHFEGLELVSFGGGYVNHLEFKFSAVEERGVVIASLVDFSQVDDKTTEFQPDGKVMVTKRREVSATGVFGSTSAALSFVMSFKPTVGEMRKETIKTVTYDGTVTGIWDMDVTKAEAALGTGGVRRWSEKASYRPGLRDTTWYRTDAKPLGISGGRGPGVLNVSGTIEVYDKSSFPTAGGLVGVLKGGTGPADYLGFIPGETTVFRDVEIGAPQGIEFAADDPSKIIAYSLDYSFTLEFAEPDLEAKYPPTSRSQAFTAPSPTGAPTS
jgi:hypothetical protein